MSGDLFMGIDESNHGRFPEVFAGIFSSFKSDAVLKGSRVKKEDLLPKTRKHKENPISKFGERYYSFLIAEKKDYDRFNNREFIGNVVASLLDRNIPEDLDRLLVFIDGNDFESRRNYAKDLIVDRYSLKRDQVKISSGGNFDRQYPLVNLADKLAHYFFRNSHEMENNPHRREFL